MRDTPPNSRCCVALGLSPPKETEDGHHWAESKIKASTGVDPVSARFMRQDFFTYQPSFKLIVAGNLGLTGKPEGIDGSRVEEMVLAGKSRKWLGIVRLTS
jgi:hypothetical protein